MKIPKIEESSSKIYRGHRIDNGKFRGVTEVTVNGETLVGNFLGMTHPSFDWGYRGTSCENLTKCILSDYFEIPIENVPDQLTYYFKKYIVANLPYNNWELKSKTIEQFIGILFREQSNTEHYAESGIESGLQEYYMKSKLKHFSEVLTLS